MNKTKLKSEKEDDPPVMPKWPKDSPIMYFTGIVILISQLYRALGRS